MALPDWSALVADAPRVSLFGKLLRIVESQKQKASLALVDNLAEHDVLETLLESSKPTRPPGTERLDYLLASPWRYPPLKWGSRFGRVHEPSIFYGALSEAALFAEAAYYRFVFLAGLSTPFAKRVVSQHTVFAARYRSNDGVELQSAPFDAHRDQLVHPKHYAHTQTLGSALREAGVTCATYLSARTQTNELNVALFAPSALQSRKHQEPREALCEAHTDEVSFRYQDQVLTYRRERFLVNGELPLPA